MTTTAYVFPPRPGLTEAEMRAVIAPVGPFETGLEHSEAVFRQMIAASAQPARAQEALASVLAETGRADEALTLYRAVLKAEPWNRTALERLIFTLDLSPTTTDTEARIWRHEWWRHFGIPAIARDRPLSNDRTPDRVLRVGYLSGDFRHHSAALAFWSVVLRHSSQIQPVCYSTILPADHDVATVNFQKGTEWHDVADLSELALADKIRADRIDVLVDCAAFTPGNRLVTFCEHPAPIQITAWGYATGLGMPACDVLFSDVVLRGSSDRVAERVVTLPCVIPWGPPSSIPAIADRVDGPPTFGAFHRLSKVNADVLAVWARVLDAVPDAQLICKGAQYMEPSVQRWITAAVGPRVRFLPTTSHHDHLQALSQIDVMLDPWPQTGGVTTCECLWMGVPVVTWIGPRMIQRASASILLHVGLSQCITDSADSYVERAAALVQNQPWLNDQRATLRARLELSAICSGYVETVEAAYRRLWRAWCAA